MLFGILKWRPGLIVEQIFAPPKPKSSAPIRSDPSQINVIIHPGWERQAKIGGFKTEPGVTETPPLSFVEPPARMEKQVPIRSYGVDTSLQKGIRTYGGMSEAH